MRALLALLIAIERIAMTVASGSLLAVMVIVVADVLLRYGLHAPLTWAHDLISYYLIAGLFFPALAHATRSGQHVRVDIVYLLLPATVRRLCDVLIGCAMALLVAFIISLLIDRLQDEFANDLVIAGFIEWPLWAMTAIPLLGMTAFLARLIVGTLDAAAALLRGAPELDSTDAPLSGSPGA